MAPALTLADLRARILQSGLLTAGQIEPFFAAGADPDALNRLVADRLLTSFQAKQLAKGRADGFFLDDKYKLLDLVGFGGMGKVYLCEHLLLHRLVAVKLLQPPAEPGSDTGRQFERFYREARAVAALNDPNIIRVFDVDRVGPNPFMVMEYADGTNLHQVVADHGPLPAARAAEYVRQAALGLQHAYEVGLVHRDIKPANLILCRDGTVKLLDLGLARFTQDPIRNQGITDRYDKHIVIGTVDFMAPEQAFETSAVDIRSDIYGLGCTLYFLLTRLVPFPDRSVPEKMYAHKTRSPAPVSELAPRVPGELLAVLDRLMAKEPADRYQTPAEVVEALQALVPREVPPPPASEMPAHPVSFYQLGLCPAPAPSSAMMATPQPVSEAPTTRTPRPAAGWNLPGYHTPPPQTPPPATGQDPSLVLATPPPALRGESSASLSRLRSARRYRRLVRLAELLLFVLAAGGVGWLASREWMHRAAPTTPAATDPAVERPAPESVFAGPVVRGGGVTFAEPVVHRLAAAYEARHRVRIDYQLVGQDRGVEGMLAGTYPFACTVVPLSPEQVEQARGEVLHVPLAVGVVAVAYNVPGLAGELRLTGPVLADMYLGTISRWNDPAIKATNPKLTLPDLAIVPVYHSQPTGTSVVWADFLKKTNPGPERKPVDPSLTFGLGARANAGVAARISRTPGAVGYLELDFAVGSKLPVAAILNREGQYVLPTPAGATAALARLLPTVPEDLRFSLTDAPGEESYPLSAMLWSVAYADQAGPEVAQFLHWATHDGQAFLADSHFARLPPEIIPRIDSRLARIRSGK